MSSHHFRATSAPLSTAYQKVSNKLKILSGVTSNLSFTYVYVLMLVAGFSYKTFVPSATKVGMCSGSPEYESIDETWDRARAWLRLVGKKHHKYNQPINLQACNLLLCGRSSRGGGGDVLSHPQQSVA